MSNTITKEALPQKDEQLLVANLRNSRRQGDSPKDLTDRYFAGDPAQTPSQSWQPELRAVVNRWNYRYKFVRILEPQKSPFQHSIRLPGDGSMKNYPRPELIYKKETDPSVEGQRVEGVGFSREFEEECFDFFDAVWIFVEQNYELLTSHKGEKNTEKLDKILAAMLKNFEESLKNNRVFAAFKNMMQVRFQDGSVKVPYAHSIKVFRNIIRQNLFSRIQDQPSSHSQSEHFPNNVNMITFWTLVLALIHDIGNLFFLDNDRWHFHAMFGRFVTKQWLMQRRNLPEELAEGLSAPIDKHHVFEAAAMHKVYGKDVTKDLSKLEPMYLFSLIMLASADASSTKKLLIEIENLREQVMAYLASLALLIRESDPDDAELNIFRLQILMLSDRLKQLDDIADANPAQKEAVVKSRGLGSKFNGPEEAANKISEWIGGNMKEIIEKFPELSLLLATFKILLLKIFGLEQEAELVPQGL